MKKTIVVLLTLAFVLSFSSCKKKGKLSGDTKLIPAGTNAIAEINVSDFLKLEKIKKELGGFEGKSFTEKTGLKPNDIKSITLFANINKLRDLDRNPDFGFLVKGNGFDSALKKLVKKGGKRVKETKYADKMIYTKKPISLSLVGKNIAGGTLENVKKILDLSKGKGKAANLKEFSAIFAKLNASSAKAAVALPESTKKELGAMTGAMPVPGVAGVLQKLEILAIGANVSSSSIEIKLVVKSDAKAIKTLVDGVKPMLKMFAGKVAGMDKQMPGAKEAFDSIKIEADGSYLKASVKIPAKMLDKM